MKTELRTLVVAAVVIGLWVTGILVRRAPDPMATTEIEPAQAIEQSDSEPTPQRQRLRPRPEPTLAHSRAATAIALPEPPDEPDEAREWARKNPHDALAWMLNAPASEKRDTVAEIACAHVAESDPARAVSLAQDYSGGCSNLLENLLHQWAERDEWAASTYASSKVPGEERDRLLSRVAFVRSKLNPAEAAKLVAEQISPGEIQNEAAISVLHQWALLDANAALSWAQLFPDEGLRARALTEVENMLPKLPE
jgi:hypothetical protein